MARVLITGGRVLSSTGAQDYDVLIDGDEIAALGTPGYFESVKPTCDRVLDASGKYVIPGGVDVHTHMELPFGGTNASDTFETGTIAAAFGGTTSIVDFAVQRTGEDVHDGLAAWHEKADGNCAIDYGFHQIIGGVDDAALKAMSDLTNNEGVTSFKLFMAYPGVFYSDDGQILRAMQTASDLGATIMMHAENGPAIDVLVAQALERGETDPRYHSLTRPAALEEEATHRAIMLAKVAKAPLYIVHVSSQGRRRGHRARARPRRQRLRRDLSAVPVPESGRAPLQARLRGCGLRLLDAAAFARRRTPGLPVAGPSHQRRLGREHRPLSVLHEGPEGTGTGQLLQDPQRHRLASSTAWTCSTRVSSPARSPCRAGSRWPRRRRRGCSASTRRKGVIAPGSDADVVIYDPKGTTDISVTTHHMNMDHSAYEGQHIDGRVVTVLSRGRVIVENNTFTGAVGHGKFLRRGLSQYLM